MVGGVAVVAVLEEDEVAGLGGLPPDPLVVSPQVVTPQPGGRPPGRVLHAGLVPARPGGGRRTHPTPVARSCRTRDPSPTAHASTPHGPSPVALAGPIRSAKVALT